MIKLSDLTEKQKQHFAWRMDAKTSIGYITAGTIARGGHGDVNLDEVFMWGGMSERQAKIAATKCKRYVFSMEKWEQQFVAAVAKLEQAKRELTHAEFAVKELEKILNENQ